MLSDLNSGDIRWYSSSNHVRNSFNASESGSTKMNSNHIKTGLLAGSVLNLRQPGGEHKSNAIHAISMTGPGMVADSHPETRQLSRPCL